MKSRFQPCSVFVRWNKFCQLELPDGGAFGGAGSPAVHAAARGRCGGFSSARRRQCLDERRKREVRCKSVIILNNADSQLEYVKQKRNSESRTRSHGRVFLGSFYC